MHTQIPSLLGRHRALSRVARYLVGSHQSPVLFIVVYMWASLVAQTVKHLPTMWETRVQSLGWEDVLEKEMAVHSGTLAWRIPWTEEPGGLQSIASQT